MYSYSVGYGGADAPKPVGGGEYSEQESSPGDRWRDPQSRAIASNARDGGYAYQLQGYLADRQDPGDKRWASSSTEDAKWGSRGGTPRTLHPEL